MLQNWVACNRKSPFLSILFLINKVRIETFKENKQKTIVKIFQGWIKEVRRRAELRGTLVRAKAIAVAIYNSMVCSEVRAEL